MEEKYIEAYYRVQALKDFIMLSDRYVSKEDVLAILGIIDSVEDGHQE